MTVKEIDRYINEFAPVELAIEEDNVGLLIGDYDSEVSLVLVALDVTRDTVYEAEQAGAQLIVCHHPPIFHPLYRLSPGEVPYMLAERGISVIAAHTNLDFAVGGLNDYIAQLFKLSNVEILEKHPLGGGNGRIGELTRAVSADELARTAKEIFGTGAVRYVSGGKDIQRVAFNSGGGCKVFEAAVKAGADAFVSGDVRHDLMVRAKDLGITLIDAGHFETEEVYMNRLAARLSEHGIKTLRSKVSQIIKYL